MAIASRRRAITSVKSFINFLFSITYELSPIAPSPCHPQSLDKSPGPRLRQPMANQAKWPRGAWSWALYDWANSAFVLTVATVFAGPFFQRYWFDGPEERAFSLNSLNVTLASLLVAVCAPLIGAFAAGGRRKKATLAAFAALGCASTVALAALPQGAWELAFAFRLTAALGFFGSLVVYDALLPAVSSPSNRHVISGLGFSLGYLGSVMLLFAQFAVVNNPGLLGFETSAPAIKLSFVTVALWWACFTVPLLLNVREPAMADTAHSAPQRTSAAAVFGEIWQTLKEIWRLPALRWFLLAYYFYIDGVNTLTQLATAFGDQLGIPMNTMMGTIILVQIVGVPCAVGFGWLGQRFGPKPFIIVAVCIYMGVTAYAFRLTNETFLLFGLEVHPFYVLGLLIGIVQGGLQALSRSLFTNLLPAGDGDAARFFGLYNMLGKGGAIMGPLLMGGVSLAFGDPRAGALAVAVLFIIGLVLVAKVRVEQAHPA